MSDFESLKNKINNFYARSLNDRSQYSEGCLYPEAIVSKYKKIVLKELHEVFSGASSEVAPGGDFLKQLQNFLKLNAQRIPYTALPHDEFRDLLCEVAEYVGKKLNISPLLALIPTLVPTGAGKASLSLNLTTDKLAYDVDDVDDIFPDLYEKPFEEMSDQMASFYKKSYVFPDLSEKPLSEVLSQNVLNKEQTLFVPLPLLLAIYTEDGQEKDTVFTPYWDPEDIEHAEEAMITPKVLTRMKHHSVHTQSFFDTFEALQTAKKRNITMYDKLIAFCKALKFNSAHGGIGSNLDAAGGAYVTIIAFQDFYNLLTKKHKTNIPPPVKEEIEFLLTLSSDHKLNQDATSNVQTCIGLRSAKLFSLTSQYKAILETIFVSITDDEFQSVRQKALADFTKNRALLLPAVTRKNYNGTDQFEVTPELTESLGVKIEELTTRDIDSFFSCSAENIKKFFQRYPQLLQSIYFLFAENEPIFFALLYDQPVKKLAVLFEGVTNKDQFDQLFPRRTREQTIMTVLRGNFPDQKLWLILDLFIEYDPNFLNYRRLSQEENNLVLNRMSAAIKPSSVNFTQFFTTQSIQEQNVLINRFLSVDSPPLNEDSCTLLRPFLRTANQRKILFQHLSRRISIREINTFLACPTEKLGELFQKDPQLLKDIYSLCAKNEAILLTLVYSQPIEKLAILFKGVTNKDQFDQLFPGKTREQTIMTVLQDNFSDQKLWLILDLFIEYDPNFLNYRKLSQEENNLVLNRMTPSSVNFTGFFLMQPEAAQQVLTDRFLNADSMMVSGNNYACLLPHLKTGERKRRLFEKIRTGEQLIPLLEGLRNSSKKNLLLARVKKGITFKDVFELKKALSFLDDTQGKQLLALIDTADMPLDFIKSGGQLAEFFSHVTGQERQDLLNRISQDANVFKRLFTTSGYQLNPIWSVLNKDEQKFIFPLIKEKLPTLLENGFLLGKFIAHSDVDQCREIPAAFSERRTRRIGNNFLKIIHSEAKIFFQQLDSVDSPEKKEIFFKILKQDIASVMKIYQALYVASRKMFAQPVVELGTKLEAESYVREFYNQLSQLKEEDQYLIEKAIILYNNQDQNIDESIRRVRIANQVFIEGYPMAVFKRSSARKEVFNNKGEEKDFSEAPENSTRGKIWRTLSGG